MSESIIDLRYLSESQPSLCIPRVFNNVTEPRIRQVFDEIGLGKISGIDIKERKNEKGEAFKRVFIHFEKWYWNEDAQAARRKLISGKEIKIVYDNPWFWKVSASKWGLNGESKQRSDAPRPHIKAHIEFEDDSRGRTTDEFGRNLRPKKETERSDDSRRRPDNRRSPEKRTVDSREHKKPDRRDVRTNTSVPIAPSLQHQIAPSLQRKVERPASPVPLQDLAPISPCNTPSRSPSNTPPRMRPTKEEETAEEAEFNIDYGNVQLPPPKRRRNLPLKKAVVLVEEADGSQREVLKDVVDRYANMSIEDKKSCEELYGDL